MADKNTPKARQEAIKELLRKARISDQKQMVTVLFEKYGIETNQAVVSRDFRRLGVVKKGDLYELPEKDVRAEILKLGIVDIVHNESMIVIKTHPGLADFVGDSIDQLADLEILGCLSGENVVFVTPRSIKQIQKTFQDLCEKLFFKS